MDLAADEGDERDRVLDEAPDPAFVHTEGRIAYANAALVRLLGVSGADALLGRPPTSIFHPRYHELIRRRHEAILEHRTAIPVIEQEVIHLVEGTIPVEVVTTFTMRGGRPSVLVVMRDLRRRKELEAQFRLLVDAVTDYAIFTLDPAGQITSWNDGAMRLYGYPVAEVLGQSHGMLFGAEDVDVDAPGRELARALSGGLALEVTNLRKDGTRFRVHSVITALRDGDGHLKGYVKVVRDLTEQRASAVALSASEERNRDLFDCIAEPLFVYDRETLGYLAVNEAAIQLYGYDREEFLGMTIKDIRPVDDVPALLDMLAASGAGPEARGLWRHRKKNGEIMHVEISARGLEFEGRPACLIHARDVSAKVEAERALAEAFTAVQQSQLLARIAGAAARLGGWVVEVGESTVTWSEQVCHVHGVPTGYRPSLEEAIGYFAPEDRAVIAQAVSACLLEGTPFDLELQLVSAPGDRRWVRSIGEAVRDATGRVVKIQGALQDVSELRQRNEAIRLSEERFRLLSKATNDAVWDWDMLSDAHWWNDGVETLLGYPRDQVEPTIQFCLDRIHPEDAEATKAIVTGAVESGAESWSAEYRFRHFDGSYIWVLDRGYILRDSAGAAVRMIGGMEDLSARKRYEERIAEQAALLDEARDAIVVRDLELLLTYCNKSAAQLYGFETPELARGSSAFTLYVERSEVEAARRATLDRGHWSGELQVNGAGSRTILVSSQWSLVRDKAGRPHAVLIISSDITEKKNLEAQIIRAQRMESIGTLAGGIAHDLNNILAPILASVDLLRTDVGDNADAIETLDTIQSCARRGADLVKQVLSFARGVSGQRAPVDLAHLSLDVARVLRDTLPRSITLLATPNRTLWTVLGDPTQLHQVLLNLCINARDAMPDGGALTVSLENIVLDETYAAMNLDARPGPYVLVKVADTGTGIPNEIMDRIFDPFFTTKEVGKGTGLGLSTTLTIVRSHGGFINVYSELGRGTKFKVYLPATTSSAVAAEVANEQADRLRGDGEVVLVVDDEEPIRKVVRRTLERSGYEVLMASHGAEAVALYAQHRGKIALVLTDMAMPVMDGPATIIAIKAMDPDARIVGSSGLASNADVAKAVGAGVRYFVAKPYTAEALLGTIGKALGKIPDDA